MIFDVDSKEYKWLIVFRRVDMFDNDLFRSICFSAVISGLVTCSIEAMEQQPELGSGVSAPSLSAPITKERIAEYRKMQNSGEIYDSVDDGFIAYQHALVQKINEFNSTPETPDGLKRRDDILREAMGTYGEGLYIIPPIYANCGLSNVHVGRNVVINFDCKFVDDGEIFIGDDVMIGPGCSIATAIHPISPKLRQFKLQFNKPVHIGNNVWLGAGAIVLPGVTIGENSIIGAGAVVTHDVEPNVIAVGNPAKVLRKITPDDDVFYDKGKRIPQDIIDKYMKEGAE